MARDTFEVGENGQNSEGVVLRPAAEFAGLVVLLCIIPGVSFKRLKTPQMNGYAEHDTKNIR